MGGFHWPLIKDVKSPWCWTSEFVDPAFLNFESEL